MASLRMSAARAGANEVSSIISKLAPVNLDVGARAGTLVAPAQGTLDTLRWLSSPEGKNSAMGVSQLLPTISSSANESLEADSQASTSELRAKLDSQCSTPEVYLSPSSQNVGPPGLPLPRTPPGLQQQPAIPPPANLGLLAGVASVGSLGHELGRCKPCAFIFKEGCLSGIECKFCHRCEPGEKKRRK